MNMVRKKLAVFFPGIGYTLDKPLMHYSRRIAADLGYEILLLPYSGFPPKVKGDKERMQESFRIALEQSEKMLSRRTFIRMPMSCLSGKSIRHGSRGKRSHRNRPAGTGSGWSVIPPLGGNRTAMGSEMPSFFPDGRIPGWAEQKAGLRNLLQREIICAI